MPILVQLFDRLLKIGENALCDRYSAIHIKYILYTLEEEKNIFNAFNMLIVLETVAMNFYALFWFISNKNNMIYLVYIYIFYNQCNVPLQSNLLQQ